MVLAGRAGVAAVRAGVATGGSAIRTVDEARFVRATDLSVAALALVLAGEARVALLASGVAERGRATRRRGLGLTVGAALVE